MVKMAVAAIARRRRLLDDDVILSLADSTWEILDISCSDVSDVGLAKLAGICRSLRAVDIRYWGLYISHFDCLMYCFCLMNTDKHDSLCLVVLQKRGCVLRLLP